MDYAEFLKELKGTIESFVNAADAGTTNKGQALAARKLSMKLTIDLKNFRKASIANDKKK